MSWKNELKKAMLRFYNSTAKTAYNEAMNELGSVPNGKSKFYKIMDDTMKKQPVIYEQDVQAAKRVAMGQVPASEMTE